MAETVLGLRVYVRITGKVLGDDGAELIIDETYDKTFSEGTGQDQVGWAWQDKTRALNATTEDLQLDGLTDFQGQTTSSNNNVKLLYFRNLDTDTGDKFTLGGSASNAWTGMLNDTSDKMDVEPDGIVLWVAPLDAGAISAGDDLQVESQDNSNYRLIMAGDNA